MGGWGRAAGTAGAARGEAAGGGRGELLTLRWSNVDLKRGRLTFPNTKNRETRTVPLPSFALEVLTRHAAQRYGSGRFVFPNATDKGPLGIRTAFKFALKHAGVKDFRFHDLRHTAASYLAMNGASLLEIAEILGHKTLAMVKRYAHLCEAHTRGVLERTTQAVFAGESTSIE
jgi:integrase